MRAHAVFSIVKSCPSTCHRGSASIQHFCQVGRQTGDDQFRCLRLYPRVLRRPHRLRL